MTLWLAGPVLRITFAQYSIAFRIRPEVSLTSDAVSDVFIDQTGVKIPVKIGDSSSNRSRDMRLPHFVTNDGDNDAGVRRSSHKGNTRYGVLPKTVGKRNPWAGYRMSPSLTPTAP